MRLLLDGLKRDGWTLAKRLDGMKKGIYECPRCSEIMSIEWYHHPVHIEEEDRPFDVCDECGFSRPVNSFVGDVFDNDGEIFRITLTADQEAKKGCFDCAEALGAWTKMPTLDALERLLFAIAKHGHPLSVPEKEGS